MTNDSQEKQNERREKIPTVRAKSLWKNKRNAVWGWGVEPPSQWQPTPRCVEYRGQVIGSSSTTSRLFSRHRDSKDIHEESEEQKKNSQKVTKT